MGLCFSNGIKGYTPDNGLLNSTNMRRDGNKFFMPQSPKREGEILDEPNLKSFSFSELKTTTRNFHPNNVLGEGAFGKVFKGWINEHSQEMAIAVKRLNPESFQGHQEWLTEINSLGRLQHPNIIKLIGYCMEDEQRLLVYEFMSRGSVQNHLFRVGSQLLSWDIRMKIALDAAKGLAFLHSANIIYRDLKTSHLLLDSNYKTKLSDFGLARNGPTNDESHVTTRVMGTYGYAAPEYVATGHLTMKCDVFSFGFVVLEILSGKRLFDWNRPREQQNLVEWVKPYLTQKFVKFGVQHFLDIKLDGQYPLVQAQKVANLALHCLNDNPKLRPDMDDVVMALERLEISN